MRSLSPIKPDQSEDAPKIGGSKAAGEPLVKITSDTMDVKARKQDTINNMSNLIPFYMNKIKANANIRITAAT